MSDTLNIVYRRQSPGSFALTYSVGGSPPNLSTGYTAAMRVWRSGLPTTAAADHTATNGAGITLGISGAITLDLVAINTALSTVDAGEAIWHYDLQVTPTGNPAQPVCAGYLVRAQP
jgi:hypothetical protein